MGIEPTCRTVYARHSDFEDRGHHQVCKHFREICQAGKPDLRELQSRLASQAIGKVAQ